MRDSLEAVAAPELVISESGSERTDRGRAGGSGLGFIERVACRIVRSGPTPQHVAFIMDGNRRFARERGWDVAQGHRQGYDKLEEALRWCCELGVHGVTVYAFSIENFKRSPEEVEALMALTTEKLRSMSDEGNLVQQRGVRVRIVGDLSRVSDSLRSEMRRVMRMTQRNTRHTLTVCFSYTSRNEMATAVRRMVSACDEGRLLPEDLSPSLLERCLPTSSPGGHAVDLIVRTSGEKRLSDFLLWQSATCAVAFTSVLWPELSLLRFLSLLLQFQRNQPYFHALGASLGDATVTAARGATHETSAPYAASRTYRSRARERLLVGSLAILMLLAVCALTAAIATHMLQTSGSKSALLIRVAGAAAAGWVLVAVMHSFGCSNDRLTADSGSPFAEKRHAVQQQHDSTCSLTPTASIQASESSARRVREFLAELNVDRRL